MQHTVLIIALLCFLLSFTLVEAKTHRECRKLNLAECLSDASCKFNWKRKRCQKNGDGKTDSPTLAPTPRKGLIKHISFAGCGFLGVYEMGALLGLEFTQAIKRGETFIAGASAGALLASAWCAGAKVEQMIFGLNSLLEKCGKNSLAAAKCNGNYEQLNADYLNSVIPSDDSWMQCNKTAAIQYTSVKNSKTCPPQTIDSRILGGVLLQSFTSRQDVINSASASSFIYLFSGPPTECAFSFRNDFAIDAGYTNVLPCPFGNNSAPFTPGSCLKTSGETPSQWYGVPPYLPYVADIYPSVRGVYPKGLTADDFANNLWANVVKVNQYKYSLVEAGFHDAVWWVENYWRSQ